MTSRSQRATTAAKTLEILHCGAYLAAARETVSLVDSLRAAREGSRLITPADFKRQLRELPRQDAPTRFEVRNETTLAAASRLLAEGKSRVMALNFASAKNPGGGFLGGSQAQEESLARASGLYACLMRFPEMYDTNRRGDSCLYTDHMIYSPDVPVFRDDHDSLLAAPYLVSILTAPAVNAGALRRNEPDNVGQIEPVMRARIEKVLEVAVAEGHTALVLGAWGCGVFKNSPADVANWFREPLCEGAFRNVFRSVVFAVFDRTATGEVIHPFAAAFAPQGS